MTVVRRRSWQSRKCSKIDRLTRAAARHRLRICPACGAHMTRPEIEAGECCFWCMDGGGVHEAGAYAYRTYYD